MTSKSMWFVYIRNEPDWYPVVAVPVERFEYVTVSHGLFSLWGRDGQSDVEPTTCGGAFNLLIVEAGEVANAMLRLNKISNDWADNGRPETCNDAIKDGAA